MRRAVVLGMAAMTGCAGAGATTQGTADGGGDGAAPVCSSEWHEIDAAKACMREPIAIAGLCVEQGASKYKGLYVLCAIAADGTTYLFQYVSKDSVVHAPAGWVFAPSDLAQGMNLPAANASVGCAALSACAPDAGAD